MPATFDDNITVIGESSRSPPAKGAPVVEDENLKTTEQMRPFPAETKLKGKIVERTSEFMQPMHVPEENRPFFVTIGRGGVIAALDELDKQLKDVGVLQMFISSYWLMRG